MYKSRLSVGILDNNGVLMEEAANLRAHQEAVEKLSVDNVLKSLQGQIEDAYTTARLLDAIVNICHNNEDSKDRFRNNWASGILVMALNTHVDDVDVVEKACMAMCTVITHSTVSTCSKPVQQVHDVMLTVGICESLINALNYHVSKGYIAVIACRTIATLCNTSNPSVCKSKLGDINACETLIQVLNTHIDDPNVVIQTCRAIAYLAHNSPLNQNKFHEAGACLAVVKTLNTHIDHKDVLSHICWTIVNLSIKHVNNIKDFAKSVVLMGLVRALSIHIDKSDVVDNVCWAVYITVSSDLENKIFLRSLNGKVLLERIKALHSSSDVVLTPCKGAIRCLQLI